MCMFRRLSADDAPGSGCTSPQKVCLWLCVLHGSCCVAAGWCVWCMNLHGGLCSAVEHDSRCSMHFCGCDSPAVSVRAQGLLFALQHL
jgi:hypothetical protein